LIYPVEQALGQAAFFALIGTFEVAAATDLQALRFPFIPLSGLHRTTESSVSQQASLW
jgi:hypothetical protein